MLLEPPRFASVRITGQREEPSQSSCVIMIVCLSPIVSLSPSLPLSVFRVEPVNTICCCHWQRCHLPRRARPRRRRSAGAMMLPWRVLVESAELPTSSSLRLPSNVCTRLDPTSIAEEPPSEELPSEDQTQLPQLLRHLSSRTFKLWHLPFLTFLSHFLSLFLLRQVPGCESPGCESPGCDWSSIWQMV